MANADRESAEQVRLLASSIAHDFNNVLGALLLHLAIAKMQAEGHEVFRTLTDAEDVALRAQALTQQLLALASPHAVVRRPVALAGPLRAAVDSAAVASGGLAGTVSMAEGLWTVDGDAGRLGYALGALVRQVADPAERGTVSVNAENVSLPDGRVPGLAGGRYVKITVTGPGRGTARGGPAPDAGLGSPSGLIEEAAGRVIWEADGERGRRLTVYLPASPARPAPAPDLGWRLNILLMDDEGLMLTVASDVLHRLGHRAEGARDGAEAVARYRAARQLGRPFDVAILDLTVPGGRGARAAIRDLRAIDPQVRAIVSTGYANDPIVNDFREEGFRAVLVKPYRVADLCEALNRAMAD